MGSPITATSAANVANSLDSIDQLTGNNFPTWKEKVEMTLGIHDLDLALRETAPIAPTVGMEGYDELKKAYDIKAEKWERSNRLSLMIMKSIISDNIRGAIPSAENAKDYLKSVEEQFQGSSKVYATTLIQRLINDKYDGSGSVREHILRMSDAAAKLKTMDMSISDNFLVHFIMTSLPPEFGPFKINYNTQKEKWTLNELTAMCVQEEERLRAEHKDQAFLSSLKRKHQGDHKPNKKLHFQKAPKPAHTAQTPPTNPSSSGAPGANVCHFCKKPGHIQKDCAGFLKWLAKRGIPYRESPKKGAKKP